MNKFILTSDYKPTGDQPEAIRQLTDGIERGDRSQVLLGVTGSGKTFTMANVIANVNKPTLILSHNKTLAAQLYEEMRGFFPQNAVEYYVSYYDYYQPEAYLPSSDTYIEKTSPLTRRLTGCGSLPYQRSCQAEATWWSFPPSAASTVWEVPLPCMRMSLSCAADK